MRFIHSILSEHQDDSKTALMFPEKAVALTYEELFNESTCLSNVLRELGASSGGRVAIWLPNSPEFAVALFAILNVGGIAVPLDTYAKKDDILRIADFTQADVIITNRSQFRKIKGDPPAGSKICLLDMSGNVQTVGCRLRIEVKNGVETDAYVSYNPKSTPVGGGAPNPSQIRNPCSSELLGQSLDAFFIMTSGSTGTPKAVRLSHQAVLNNIQMHLDSLEIDSEIVGLQVLPMNYSYGLIASFLSILYNHGTAILMSSVEANRVARCIDQFKINLFMGTPTTFRYLFDQKRLGSKMDSLRHITLGGDKCHPYLANMIQQNLPDAKVYITYGVTETGPRVSTLPPRYFSTHSSSIGKPLSGVEVRILDESGTECPPNETGEIVVRTPSIMNGYFGNDAATTQVLRDGWYYTGDLGSKDCDGFLYYAGRKDNGFKINGKKVNPTVIEDCICSHPSVQECRISKVEDERTEHIRAVIKAVPSVDGAQNGSDAALIDELRKFCRKRMSLHLVPREFSFDETGQYYFKGKVVKSLPHHATLA
jgi:acyl-CoA synthetase (AMP-forming)/AMP-acid ligase II